MFDIVLYNPGIAHLSGELNRCKEILGETNEAHYKNENGELVMCFRGECEGCITVIISCP